MGTKRNPGTFDCYMAAGPDEPMFVLLGRDPVAPELVRQWAERRLNAAAGKPTDREAAKIAEAMACAKAMEEFAAAGTPVPPVQGGGGTLAELVALVTIEGVLAEAMAAAYREGWGDSTIANRPGRRRFFKPSPEATDRARDLLADDWVPAHKRPFFDRIIAAVAGAIGRPLLTRPRSSWASGKRAMAILIDEVEEDLRGGRMSPNDARAAIAELDGGDPPLPAGQHDRDHAPIVTVALGVEVTASGLELPALVPIALTPEQAARRGIA